MTEPVTFEELAPLFFKLGAKREGSWLMTFCPSHPDGAKSKKRSLGLAKSGVMKCFAGCTETGAGFKEVYEKLYELTGMEKPDRERPAIVPFRRGPESEPSKVYQYKDTDGKLFAEKGRFDRPDGSKTFAWRKPYTDGWFGGGVDALDAPLYHADELAKVPMDEWVFFCEGEKAADACIANGLFALTHGGGSSIRDFRESLDILRGRHVALWPDNDEAGRKYMLAVQRALKGVARETRWIAVPVKEKGDAFDYFGEGGTADDVFRSAWDKPLVEYISQEHIRVTCYTEAGPLAFDFDSMEQVSSYELTAWLTIAPLSKGFEDEPISERINLLSSSAIESLERRIRKHYGLDVNWMFTINQAISRATKTFRETDRGVTIGSIEMVGEHLEYLIDGILIKGHHTIFFGDGASTKTLNSYAMGIAIASGASFLGRPTKRCGVLIVDYETRALTARHRVDRLTAGLGGGAELVASLNMHYWPAKGMPLAAQQEALRRYIEKYDIGLVIVDSGGMACGSAPEKSSSATSYFNAIERIGDATVITICHVSAAGLAMPEPGKYPFGCYSDDTEVLTNEGWKLHQELTQKEAVACFDPATGTLRWELPEHYHEYDYAGEMHHYSGRSLNMLVTPNHRMVVRHEYDKEWSMRESQDLSKMNWIAPLAAPWEDEFPDADPDFMRFLGWWISEGSLNDMGPVLTQACGPLADEMERVVGRLGFASNRWNGKTRTHEVEVMQLRLRGATGLGRWLADESGFKCHEKRIPEACFATSQESRRILFQSLMEGDGHIEGEGRWSYATTSEKLAGDVQRLAISLGYQANVSSQPGAKPHHHRRYVVFIAPRSTIAIRPRNMKTVEYSAKVYCLTVPTGAYVTRRNGKMGISGNSRYWHYLARDTFYVQAAGVGTDTINASFIPRKNNDYPAKPFAVQADFMGGPGGPIVLSEGTYREPSKALSTASSDSADTERIYASLLSDGEMKVWELSSETDIASAKVVRLLEAGKGSMFDYSYAKDGVRLWRAI